MQKSAVKSQGKSGDTKEKTEPSDPTKWIIDNLILIDKGMIEIDTGMIYIVTGTIHIDTVIIHIGTGTIHIDTGIIHIVKCPRSHMKGSSV